MAQSPVETLGPVTVLATKTVEQVWDSLSATSTVGPDQIQQLMPSKPSDLLFGVPGVSFQERADDPGSAINIRGLQDFGRVAVLIDGARQNFQRTGHNADGLFYLEPEMIGGAQVVRGPIANIYGSGAIGGVVSFNTKDVNDVLRPGQTWGILSRGEGGSNESQGVGSTFAAARIGPNAEFIVGATYRSKSDYKDGDGNEIPNTHSEPRSQIAKVTVRPAEGHELKFSYLNFDTKYDTGQPYYSSTTLFDPVTFAPITYTGELSTIYRNEVNNQIASVGYTYSRHEDQLFDFSGKVYWTKTGTGQEKIDGIIPPPFALGNIGDTQSFTIATKGVDVHNSSRFDLGSFKQVLTIGGDGFRDEVDTNGGGQVFTPSGERTVSGAFVQLKSNYSTWLEIIGAARYDNYELQGGGYSAKGDRVSPKITVGITPIPGIMPYATYAEGYRAPAITETLVAGIHPIFFAPFQFIANPGLRPEIGKTKEVGVNFKFDNIFMQGDAFRGKVNAYRNDVTNYIESEELTTGQVAQGGLTCTHTALFGGFAPLDPDCVQYQNIAKARLEGYEAETNYDAGTWFAGVNYSHVKGHDLNTGESLAKIAPDSVTTTLGARFFDRKLTVALRWKAVDAKHASDIPQMDSGVLVFPVTGSYNLVNLYVGYQPTPDILAGLSIENLLNEQYAIYTSVYPDPASSQRVPVGFPQPGITIKGSLQIRFSDDLFKRG